MGQASSDDSCAGTQLSPTKPGSVYLASLCFCCTILQYISVYFCFLHDFFHYTQFVLHFQESKNKKGAVPRLSDAHENRLKVPQLKINAKGQSESEGKMP